jgi:hypothetical protein
MRPDRRAEALQFRRRRFRTPGIAELPLPRGIEMPFSTTGRDKIRDSRVFRMPLGPTAMAGRTIQLIEERAAMEGSRTRRQPWARAC